MAMTSGFWSVETFSARWDSRTGLGLVRQSANPYSLDAVLRIVHSLILAERGGFLLHAASAICEGRAYLFSGVSGAGKTTMTRLAPPDITLLTDEMSYLRPERQSGYRAFGTPFAGELARSGENCSAPVAALFFSGARSGEPRRRITLRGSRSPPHAQYSLFSPRTRAWSKSCSPPPAISSPGFPFAA